MSYFFRKIKVIGAPISGINWTQAVDVLEDWAAQKKSRVVCICNTHSLVAAKKDLALAKAINEADLATPDGAPVAWMMRLLGVAGQARINGPDLMWQVLARLNKTDSCSIFLFGNTEATNELLIKEIEGKFPRVRIAGVVSPPFRPSTVAESEEYAARINSSGAGIVWVSLGCPKQEIWMDSMRGRVDAVMVGVGAAFDYHAGTIKRAPMWMRSLGLEWLHRLCSEPRRLWRRYLYSNTLYLYYAALQFVAGRPR